MLRARNLKKQFAIRRGWWRPEVSLVQAVDGVSFDIRRGETLGLVGESGCGKSTTGRLILQLTRPTAGEVIFNGRNLTTLPGRELPAIRRDMQIIFQDPYASLNPRMTVGDIVAEPLLVHNMGDRRRRRQRVNDLLAMVGLNPSLSGRYPHEFSGGQRQRVGIARALATNPSFIVADEPISSLDVSIQAQIIILLDDLKQELGLTYLFIAHDLAVIRYLSDRVAVMYLGRIVELGQRDAVFERPLHPYTQALIAAIPIADPALAGQRPPILLEGEAPSPVNPPAGCRFHPRCPHATDLCRRDDPPLRDLGTAVAPQWVACHHAEKWLAGVHDA